MKIAKYNLRKLKSQFEKNVFAIPEIQRQYVWNKRQVLGLMDSILNHYPIDIGLIWRAPYSKAIHIRPNNKTIVPPFNRKNKHAYLVIDGQQRLSTLYGTIFGMKPMPEVGSQIDFTELFFDCNPKAKNKFLFSRKYDENTKGVIRLTTLINTPPYQLKKRMKLLNWVAKAAEKCFHAFHSYSFHLLAFDGLDYNDVKEIFIRINSAGTTVSRADTLFARATDVNLRDHLLNTRRGLKHGYNNISIEAMQNTIALVYGANRIDAKAYQQFLQIIEKDKKHNKTFHRTWRKLEYGYEEATDFLVNYLKVSNSSLLPSQNLYSMLAYFFHLNQSRAKPNQIKEIKKWFWYTCCGERYSGAGFNRNIPEDIRFFKRLASNKTAKFSVNEKIDPVDFLKTNYKSSGSTISTAYKLLLRAKKPLYLANGQEMLLDNHSSISNRKDQHHVFPNNLLRRNNINPRWVNSIANICYLESDENQSISNKHPSKYLITYKRSKHFSRVMKSHLIPCATDQAVWEKNIKKAFPKFLSERGKFILKEIETLAGSKIFNQFNGISRI
jgi:hypothetical protein